MKSRYANMPVTFRVLRAMQTDGRTTAAVEWARLYDLSPGEVVIRACYSDVNYKDALAATGRNGIIRQFPRVPGIDVAGVVESSSDPRFRAGDPVLVTGYEFGTGHDGGYAEYVRAPADWVVPVPDGLSLYEAMALGTAGFTVALCMKRLEENGQRPGQGPIAVTGATGGVGSIAIDVLSRLGYSVTAITGKSGDADYLRMLGAAEVLDRQSIVYGSQPLERAIWAGAIDNVGGETLAWLTRTMRQNGVIASFGNAGGVELHTTVMPFILRGVRLIGIDSAATAMPLRREIWRRLATDLRPRLLAQVAHIVPFAELPQVFPQLLQGRLRGRTVVRMMPAEIGS